MKSAGHGIWIFVCLRIFFKGCVRYIFASLFFKSKGEHLGNKEKCFFISLQKFFSFARKSNFRIWDKHLPKHRTRNKFYWITREVNSLLMEFDQFMSYHKRKRFIRKLYENCSLKTSPRPFYACKELGIPLLENETFEASYSH